MYPLDRGMWGPTVRISHIRDGLADVVSLDVVSGYRGKRRGALARYAFSGRLRGLDGIYVESSSFLPAEADIAFLGLAKAMGIPVLTYIRDAYQLFDDYRGAASVRERLGRAAFRPTIAALRAVSTRLAFPSAGLARAVLGDEAETAVLLPPGSPAPVDVARRPDAGRLLFVGDARLPAQGADRLIGAVAQARAKGVKIEVEIVSRPGQEPPGAHPTWMHVRRAEGDAIHALLPDVLATVIPRPRGPYNDLSLPIKLFDYLSYGRPLLVTGCTEQARIVREADAGLVVDDDVDALAGAIAGLASTPSEQLDAWSRNAHAAAREASWTKRAAQIRDLLMDR